MSHTSAKEESMERRCYYCGRFVSWRTWARNWKLIQAPGVADPEPYEVTWCDRCEADGAAE